MVRQLLMIRDDAAHVDDAREPCLFSGVRDDRGRTGIEVDEIVAQHRVHQVEEHLLTLERPPHRVGVSDVALDYLDVLAPRHIVKLGGRSGHYPDFMARRQQFGNQPDPSIAGGAEDDAAHISLLDWPGSANRAAPTVVYPFFSSCQTPTSSS